MSRDQVWVHANCKPVSDSDTRPRPCVELLFNSEQFNGEIEGCDVSFLLYPRNGDGSTPPPESIGITVWVHDDGPVPDPVPLPVTLAYPDLPVRSDVWFFPWHEVSEMLIGVDSDTEE